MAIFLNASAIDPTVFRWNWRQKGCDVRCNLDVDGRLTTRPLLAAQRDLFE